MFLCLSTNEKADIFDEETFTIKRVSFSEVNDMLKSGIRFKNIKEDYDSSKTYTLNSFKRGLMDSVGYGVTDIITIPSDFVRFLLSKLVFDKGELIVAVRKCSSLEVDLSVWYDDYSFTLRSKEKLLVLHTGGMEYKISHILSGSITSLGIYNDGVLIHIDRLRVLYFNKKSELLTVGMRSPRKKFPIAKCTRSEFIRGLMFE